LSPQADVRGVDGAFSASGASFNVVVTDRLRDERKTVADMTLPMYGMHNVQNALAAFAVGHEMGLDEKVMRKALSTFAGVKRRFTKPGEVDGITVIDDYGHHPVEISAV